MGEDSTVSASGTRPFHVVQFGYDDRVFQSGSASDTLRRQLAYGETLERLRAGAIMTLLVVTRLEGAVTFARGNLRFIPFRKDRRSWRKISAWIELYRVLERIDRESRIDVLTTQTIHDDSWIVLLFGLLANRPVVGQVHYDVYSPHVAEIFARGVIGRIRYALLLRGIPWFSRLRVVGERIAKSIRDRWTDARVEVIPVAMPLLGEPAALRAAEREPLVLFVGRLVAQKNLEGWLDIAERVARRINGCRFVIVGEGPLRTSLMESVATRGIGDRIEFTGAVDYDQLGSYYARAQVFLMSSAFEGFGRVVAEALFHRVPVVAFRVAGVEDIVQHATSGFLHEFGDSHGMSESVCSLLQDPILLSRMGEAGRADVLQRFDPNTLSERWMKMLIDATSTEGAREAP